MATVHDNVVAYDDLRVDLEARHMGEWVVIHDEQLAGIYPDLQTAAEDAVERFGRGPYHIKQIGEPPFVMTPVVFFGPQNARD